MRKQHKMRVELMGFVFHFEENQMEQLNAGLLHLKLGIFFIVSLLPFQYLQNHPQIFQLSPDGNKVSLKETHKLLFKLDSHGQNLQSPSQKNDVQWNCEKSPPRPRAASAGCHWFDLNDSKVQPIKEKDIEKQFQGKESAYMLFYRKAQLKRPPEGTQSSSGDSGVGGGFLLRHFFLEGFFVLSKLYFPQFSLQ